MWDTRTLVPEPNKPNKHSILPILLVKPAITNVSVFTFNFLADLPVAV